MGSRVVGQRPRNALRVEDEGGGVPPTQPPNPPLRLRDSVELLRMIPHALGEPNPLGQGAQREQPGNKRGPDHRAGALSQFQMRKRPKGIPKEPQHPVDRSGLALLDVQGTRRGERTMYERVERERELYSAPIGAAGAPADLNPQGPCRTGATREPIPRGKSGCGAPQRRRCGLRTSPTSRRFRRGVSPGGRWRNVSRGGRCLFRKATPPRRRRHTPERCRPRNKRGRDPCGVHNEKRANQRGGILG